MVSNFEKYNSQKQGKSDEMHGLDSENIRGLEIACKNITRRMRLPRGTEQVTPLEFEPKRGMVIFSDFVKEKYDANSKSVPNYKRFVPLKGTDLYLDVDTFQKDISSLTRKEIAVAATNIEKFCVSPDVFKPLQKEIAAFYKYNVMEKTNTFNFNFAWPKEKKPDSYDENIEEESLKIIFVDGSEEVLSREKFTEALSSRTKLNQTNIDSLVEEFEVKKKNKYIKKLKSDLKESGFNEEELNDLNDSDIEQFAKETLS